MTNPLVPPTVTTEEEWREFQVFHVFQQTRHLDRIRTYTGWLLALVVAGIVISVLTAIVAAGSAPSYY
ncbi:hypothetical protein SAMN05660657_04032 [Geodermatophilus amargosae]|uniref:Uncharacterized protein n=1 Tax=Geodermatophilus amargosae TaxID=1296565 RepID=A0A1I7C3D3_9ACTN|nr:hypothetical protein [Geodermatophilus amargosae]SFT93957.1 hypothetical protein SAMN05660657_04032 [Geodermatophilus amargosae]